MGDRSSQMIAQEADGLVRFLHLAGGIKRLPRSGWLDRGMDPLDCESVADHSWRVCLLAWVAATWADASLDLDRVIRLALIHDLAEALAGDETPYDRDAVASLDAEARAAFLDRRHLPDGERSRRKAAAERAAFERMTASLPPAIREEFAALRDELAARETPEARFVKDADRLETFLQSREYARELPGFPVASFAAEVAETIADPDAATLRDAIAGYGFGVETTDPAPNQSGAGPISETD